MQKAIKGREMYNAFLAQGWEHKRTTGSHRIMRHTNGQTFPLCFSDKETIGPKMIQRIVAKTGLTI